MLSISRLSRFVLLPELQLTAWKQSTNSMSTAQARKTSNVEVCPKCANPSTSIYDHRIVTIKDAPIRGDAVRLRIKKRRFYCKTCRKPFTEPVEGVGLRKRTTYRYQREVLWAAENFSDLNRVRRQYRCSSGFIYKTVYEQLELRRRSRVNYPWPSSIGIDEHFFTRRRGRAEFATVFTDHSNRRLREVAFRKEKGLLINQVQDIPGRENGFYTLNGGEMKETNHNTAISKVPELTLIFWIIKIAATTLGETGGDAISMSMNLGYLVSTAIFAALFLVAVVIQIKAPRFHPLIYWMTIIATTTVGTTLADFADRTLGIGYAGGSTLLLVLLLGSLFVWHRTLGSISVNSVSSPKAEMFYWVTIMFSQTLATALGDWTADSAGFGYGGSAIIFASLIALVAALHFWTKISKTILFWAAFILTRPLGAVVGDYLDKPHDHGGLELSRYTASAVLFAFMLACIFSFRERAAERAH